jgi:hypothetical protein
VDALEIFSTSQALWEEHLLSWLTFWQVAVSLG